MSDDKTYILNLKGTPLYILDYKVCSIGDAAIEMNVENGHSLKLIQNKYKACVYTKERALKLKPVIENVCDCEIRFVEVILNERVFPESDKINKIKRSIERDTHNFITFLTHHNVKGKTASDVFQIYKTWLNTECINTKEYLTCDACDCVLYPEYVYNLETRMYGYRFTCVGCGDVSWYYEDMIEEKDVCNKEKQE